MEQWEKERELVLWEEWETVKNKAQKVLSEILKEKEETETFVWAMEKVQKPKLKELKDFFNIEKGHIFSVTDGKI